MTKYKKLEELKYRPLRQDGQVFPISEVELSLPESCHLPVDYTEFVTAYPYSGVFDLPVVFKPLECSPWADAGMEGLDALYGRCNLATNDLIAVRSSFIDVLDPRFLIIGEMTGNAFVCLNTGCDRNGCIYSWDRESSPAIGTGMFSISKTFNEFLSVLRTETTQEQDEDPELIGMTLSNDFRRRAAEILAKQKK